MKTQWVLCFSLLLASQAFAANSITLRVLTYNVSLLKAPVVGDVVKLVDDRAKKLPTELSSFAKTENIDVIALQEVWDDKHADSIKAELAQLGFEFARNTSKSTFNFGDGLLVAYRNLYLEKSEFAGFKKKAGFEGFTQKGFSVLKLSKAKDEPAFLVLNTHLQTLTTKNSVATVKAEDDASLDQIKQLGGFIDNSANKALPALLMGDFNCGPGYAQKSYDALLALGVSISR